MVIFNFCDSYRIFNFAKVITIPSSTLIYIFSVQTYFWKNRINEAKQRKPFRPEYLTCLSYVIHVRSLFSCTSHFPTRDQLAQKGVKWRWFYKQSERSKLHTNGSQVSWLTKETLFHEKTQNICWSR